MKTCRIYVMVLFGAFCLPLLFAQGPQPEARKEAQTIFKGYREKLSNQKPAAGVIESLKVLEEIANELHRGTPTDIQLMLGHRDPAVRRQACKTLAAIGVTPYTASGRVEDMQRYLKDRDPDVVAEVLLALAEFGPHAKPAIPKALEAFKSDDPRIRRAAINMLGRLLRDNKELMPIMISALDDPDTGTVEKQPGFNSVSMVAMFGIVRCGTAAKDAAPKLVEIVKKRKYDDFYENVALGTLIRLKPDEPIALEMVREMLRRKDSPEQIQRGAGFFGGLQRHGKAAVPELIAALEMNGLADANMEQRMKLQIVSALRWIGPGANQALPVLRALTKTEDLTLRREVLKTIKVLEANK